MLKRMLIMIALFVFVVGAFIGYKWYTIHQIMQQMAGGPPPSTVSVITASNQDWQPQLHAVGSLRAVTGADLSSEVAGIVEDIKFESGSDVTAGTVLVQLRAEDDIAKLQSLQAAQKIADINFDRDQKQLRVQAVSQATVDNDQAVLDGAKAQVNAQQAILDKKTIKAPFAGHLGIRQVDVGQYLNPGMAIVTLQQLDPIYIDFTLPEQSVSRLAMGQKVSVHTDTNDGQVYVGKITAINSKVDTDTRNLYVRATLDNPDHKLLPGMFANVTVDAGTVVRYLTVPQTAVVYNTYGNTVYLVKKKTADDTAGDDKSSDDKSNNDDKTQLVAQQTVVVTGETRGDQVAVMSGIKEGDQVVSSGQVKLHSGAPVVINNDVQPANDPNPTPHDR